MRKSNICLIMIAFMLLLLLPVRVKADGPDVPAIGSIHEVSNNELKAEVVSNTEFWDNGTLFAGSVRIVGRGSSKIARLRISDLVYIGDDWYKVVGFAPNAFKGDKYLKNLTIFPDCTIDTIPQGLCQNCKNLKVAMLKSLKITTIEKNAFSGCKNLKMAYLPTKQLETVQSNSFKKVKKCTFMVHKSMKNKYK